MKFFRLTRNERLGLIGFIIIFIGILSFKYLESRLDIKYYPSSIEAKDNLHPLDTLKKVKRMSELKKRSKLSFPKKIIISPFEKFNPNEVDETYWNRLGFPNKLSSRLNKFIKNGNGIKSFKDLEVLYGMKQEWINLLKDSIIVPKYIVLLNTCEKAELEKLNGIGSVTSKRIIKFRKRLGGFYSINQLYEVYGIDSLVISKNKNQFRIDKKCKKINVQSAGMNALSNHIYINNSQAEEIVKLRSVYGSIDSTSLRNIFTISEWTKVINYLEWKN